MLNFIITNFLPFTSHRQDATGALRVLLSFGSANNVSGVLLRIKSGRGEVAISVPFRVIQTDHASFKRHFIKVYVETKKLILN